LLDTKALIEGQCKNIRDKGWRSINLCEHVTRGTCSLLTVDWQRKLCEGFYTADYNIFRQALNYPDFIKLTKTTEEDLVRIFSVFLGFKYRGDINKCNKLASRLTGSGKFMCEIIFGRDDVDSIWNDIVHQISLFYVAKKYNFSGLCSEIEDRKIKSDCFDSRVTRLD